MIHRKAKVYAVSDQHQAVEAMVTVAPFIRIHFIMFHVILCLLATQLLEDALMRNSPNPTCGCVDEHVTVMCKCVTVKFYFVINLFAANLMLDTGSIASQMLINTAKNSSFCTNHN